MCCSKQLFRFYTFYMAQCSSPFVGQNCEIDLNLDTCQPGICRSHSTCSPLVKGGFRCENCSPSGGAEHYTKLCELRSRSFSKASFLTFPSLRQRHRLHIRLRYYNNCYSLQHVLEETMWNFRLSNIEDSSLLDFGAVSLGE
jgi:hypothetical protein